MILIGCKNVNEPLSFTSIDYSSHWGFFNSVKILNSGKVYIYYKDFLEDACYYYSELNKTQLDSLSALAAPLYTIKIDSVYKLERDSGRDFGLIIKSEKGLISTSYSGPYDGVNGLAPLFKFIEYLDLISDNIRRSGKSGFVFESKKKLERILTPPPPLLLQ